MTSFLWRDELVSSVEHLRRAGYTDLIPSPIGGSNSYDYLVNPYGSTYDARASGIRAAGGYDIVSSTCGLQVSTTSTNTGDVNGVVSISTGYSTLAQAKANALDKIDFPSFIMVSDTATGYFVIQRSRFRGTNPSPSPSGANKKQGLVYNKSAMVLIVADCEAVPDNPVPELNCFYGKNILLYRNHIWGSVDGHGSLGGCEAYGNWFEKLTFLYPDTAHSDGTHNDTIQIHQGDGHKFWGNRFSGFTNPTTSQVGPTGSVPTYTTSCVLVGNAGGSLTPTNMSLRYNMMEGGGFQVNIAPGTYANLGEVVYNQHHLHDTLKGQYTHGNNTGICAPNAGGTANTIHCNIPSSGTGANVDETGTVFAPRSVGGALIYP